MRFSERLKIYIQKSQSKTDSLPIFSPVLQDFIHFIHLWNIPNFCGLFRVGYFRPAWRYFRVVGGWVRCFVGCINPFLLFLISSHWRKYSYVKRKRNISRNEFDHENNFQLEPQTFPLKLSRH